eukprot:9425241-Alexandrium_andersonii.AAC.1
MSEKGMGPHPWAGRLWTNTLVNSNCDAARTTTIMSVTVTCTHMHTHSRETVTATIMRDVC